MSTIRFEILPPVAQPAEPIIVCGGAPELGGWDPAKALRLSWRQPFHVGEIDLMEGSRVEYKILRDSWEAEAVDAWGHVTPNLTHDVWLNATRHHVVADWKDRYRGRLTRESLHSTCLASARDILIWLPPDYSNDPSRRFPVVLLHDGRNVFDPTTSPLSGVDWAADEWVCKLADEGAFPQSIVVGICHPEEFSEENESLRDVDLSPQLGGPAYAEFLATELIPYLDSHYRTLARPEARLMAGAGLGALFTLYFAVRHRGLVTRLACLSTSFEDVSRSLPEESPMLAELERNPFEPGAEKLFFDYGSQGLDECYEPYHRRLGELLRGSGWRDEQNLHLRRVQGGSHSELSWRFRLGDALWFLR